MITSKPEQIVDTIIIWFYSFNNNNTFFFSHLKEWGGIVEYILYSI